MPFRSILAPRLEPEPQGPYGKQGRAGVLILGLPHLVVEGLLPLAAEVQQQELERPLLVGVRESPQPPKSAPSHQPLCTKHMHQSCSAQGSCTSWGLQTSWLSHWVQVAARHHANRSIICACRLETTDIRQHYLKGQLPLYISCTPALHPKMPRRALPPPCSCLHTSDQRALFSATTLQRHCTPNRSPNHASGPSLSFTDATLHSRQLVPL